jgi:hypothetical protein
MSSIGSQRKARKSLSQSDPMFSYLNHLDGLLEADIILLMTKGKEETC